MAIFNTPLGMNVKDNPLKESPFVINAQIGDNPIPATQSDILTEHGFFILLERGDFITTE